VIQVRGRDFFFPNRETEEERLQKQIAVDLEDLGYIQNLGGFTTTARKGLTEKGRLDSEAICSAGISTFPVTPLATKPCTSTTSSVSNTPATCPSRALFLVACAKLRSAGALLAWGAWEEA
jgi:hypothetical protein